MYSKRKGEMWNILKTTFDIKVNIEKLEKELSTTTEIKEVIAVNHKKLIVEH